MAVNVLDIVSTEVGGDLDATAVINPGPFQFHGDLIDVRRWMAETATVLQAVRGPRAHRPAPSPGDSRVGPVRRDRLRRS